LLRVTEPSDNHQISLAKVAVRVSPRSPSQGRGPVVLLSQA